MIFGDLFLAIRVLEEKRRNINRKKERICFVCEKTRKLKIY